MANEKIVTLENLTTYNDKIQDKIDAIDERVSVLENNPSTPTMPTSNSKIIWVGTSIPAGIGENSYELREGVMQDMEYLGVDFDFELNKTAPRGTIIEFTKPSSRTKVYRIPTDEEYMIAMDTADLAK